MSVEKKIEHNQIYHRLILHLYYNFISNYFEKSDLLGQCSKNLKHIIHNIEFNIVYNLYKYIINTHKFF